MPGIVGYDTFIGERRAADRLWRCDADPGVIDRMVSHLAREAEVGGYDSADELVVARRRVASLLGLEHGNVSLSDSGTSATVSLFQAMATAGSSPSGGFIVTDPREFGPNHELLRRLAARSGAGIRLLGLTPEGRLDIDQLGQLVSAGRVGLVWLSLAHAHAGSTNAVSELVRALDGRPTETWVVLDACQSFGQLDDDLAALDPDAVIGTSRKWLRGPRGVGFGWVHPRRLGVRATHEAIVERAVWLRHELGELPGWRIIDDPATASGIVSLAPSGAIGTHADTVGRTQRELAERGVRVTASQLHHAPIAMESLGVGAAWRPKPISPGMTFAVRWRCSVKRPTDRAGSIVGPYRDGLRHRPHVHVNQHRCTLSVCRT